MSLALFTYPTPVTYANWRALQCVSHSRRRVFENKNQLREFTLRSKKLLVSQFAFFSSFRMARLRVESSAAFDIYK